MFLFDAQAVLCTFRFLSAPFMKPVGYKLSCGLCPFVKLARVKGAFWLYLEESCVVQVMVVNAQSKTFLEWKENAYHFYTVLDWDCVNMTA